MKISARNQINGIITAVEKGAVNGIVKMSFGDNKVSSTISLSAIEELGLVEGKEAVAIVKATEVMIGVGEIGRISARNIWKGVVADIQEGAVNGIVKLDINGVMISATISMNAIADLELKVGMEASAIVKSTSVMMMA
ncbi:MAG: TOBE domain-containing protein [Lachnospiraceae bacterium]|nr:TOBE domain-containing protein [Lachnospiraceae bacterium]